MRSSRRIIYFITVISFIVFSLLSTIHFWSFNESFYRREHEKLMLYGKHISEYIGISDEDLDRLTSFTLDYLNDPAADLDIQMEVHGKMREIFTEDEKLHMIDVRNLNLLANRLIIVSFVLCVMGFIYVFANRKDFYSFLQINRKVYFFLAAFLILLAGWILIDFNSFWNNFHHVFFAGNDLWILDLSKDILIMIVPPEFFFHLVLTIFLTFLTVNILYNIAIGLLARRAS